VFVADRCNDRSRNQLAYSLDRSDTPATRRVPESDLNTAVGRRDLRVQLS